MNEQPKFPIRLEVIKPLELANGKRRRIEDLRERKVAELFRKDGAYCLDINGRQLWVLTTKGQSGRAYGSREPVFVNETDPNYRATLKKATKVNMDDIEPKFRSKGCETLVRIPRNGSQSDVQTTCDLTLESARDMHDATPAHNATPAHDATRELGRELGRELAQQSSEIVELQETLQGERAKAARDQRKMLELERSCEEATGRCALSESRLMELSREREADKAAIAAMHEQVAEYRRRVHQLESESAHNESMRRSMESERSQHNESLLALERDVRDRDAEIASLRQEVNSGEAARTSAREAGDVIATLNAKLSEAEAALSDLADKGRMSSATIAGLEADLAAAGSHDTDEHEAVKGELEQMRHCSAKEISMLRAELDGARQSGLDAGEMGDELERARSELAEAALEKERHTGEAEDMRRTIAELRCTLAEVQASSEESRARLEAMVADVCNEHKLELGELHNKLCQHEVESAREQGVRELLCYILARCKQAQQCAASLYLLR